MIRRRSAPRAAAPRRTNCAIARQGLGCTRGHREGQRRRSASSTRADRCGCTAAASPPLQRALACSARESSAPCPSLRPGHAAGRQRQRGGQRRQRNFRGAALAQRRPVLSRGEWTTRCHCPHLHPLPCWVPHFHAAARIHLWQVGDWFKNLGDDLGGLVGLPRSRSVRRPGPGGGPAASGDSQLGGVPRLPSTSILAKQQQVGPCSWQSGAKPCLSAADRAGWGGTMPAVQLCNGRWAENVQTSSWRPRGCLCISNAATSLRSPHSESCGQR